MVSHHKPLEGRRLYFVGIGGSGLSAYANVAHALGAEVRGWDAQETIFTETLGEIEVDLGGEPRPPDAFEVVVSTAHLGRVAGTPRADFLAELVATQPVDRRDRGPREDDDDRDDRVRPAGKRGTTRPGSSAAWCRSSAATPGRARVGSSSRGTSRTAPRSRCRPSVAVVTNVELDHHATYGSTAELQEAIDTWLAGVPEVVRGWELEPVDFALAVPGEHNRRNAAAALEALVRVGVEHRDAVAALARFEGADRRFQLVGARGGIAVVDDYGHNPTELRAALETARPRTTGRLVAVYVPHVVERTRHLYRELGEALGLADVAIVTDFVGRRDAPREGVSGRLVLDAVPEPTRRIWAPTLEDAAGLALRVLRPGDMVVTLGVGEPWRAARAIVDGLPGPDES